MIRHRCVDDGDRDGTACGYDNEMISRIVCEQGRAAFFKIGKE